MKTSRHRFVIVGAGLSGLVCARALLQDRRVRPEDVVLLEKSDRVGGRVCSRKTSGGFILDDGFQILLDSYPALRRWVDLSALQTGAFDSGALISEGTRLFSLAHPLLHLRELPGTIFSTGIPLADKIRLAALLAALLQIPDEKLLADAASARDRAAAVYLRELCFSEACIRRFFVPFFGGVFLDPELKTSGALLRYYLKKFATGRALLPAKGMQAVPDQLASGLPEGVLRTGMDVLKVESKDGKVNSLRCRGGERIQGEAFIFATERAAADALLGLKPEVPGRSTRMLYLATWKKPCDQARLTLVADPHSPVLHFAPISLVCPERAPRGVQLLQVTLREGGQSAPDASAIVSEIARITRTPDAAFDVVAELHVPSALRHQSPGFLAADRRRCPPFANLIFSGDQTGPCSIQHALASGEEAAHACLASA